MKKIFLALAAVAALASCVKENALVPEQTADNLVTITAVSADTKTVLDGSDVLWQNNDAIKVVLTEDASYKYDIELTTSLDVDAETAEFTFTAEDDENVQKFNNIKADSELDEKGYAIYPSTSAQYIDGFQIIHELPEEQDGIVDPGMNLSSALVTTADIKAGEANAMFNNALTLLQIKVPAGVTSVSLTANYGLAGRLEFNKPDAEGKLTGKSYKSEQKTVTLSTGSALNTETVYSLLVYPGNATELTLRMTGLDANDVYEKTISKVLEPSTYYTMDLTKIFNIGVIAETTLKASSAGDEFVIPVVDAEDYEYEVVESADWITANILKTRAFSGKEIVLTVAANDGEAREAQVSIVCERETRTFTVSQEGKAELSFVYVDPEDPESGLIQWEETFDIYNIYAQNMLNPVKTYENVFTISLSEGAEMAHGTYKIENIFYANRQTQGTKGGTYFANYSDGVLTIKTNEDDGAIRSYYFNNDIELTYDKEAKTFALAAPVPYSKDSFNGDLQEGYIGNYSVAIKVSDPGAGGASAIDNLVGNTWVQSCTGSYSMSSFNTKVTITKIDATHVSISNLFEYATISSAVFDPSAMTLTVPAGWTHMYVGPIPLQEVVFNVSNDYKTLTCTASPLALDYMSVTGYKLTKE